MEVQINWLAVVLATVSAMVIGSVWYTPKVFGKSWMKLIGKSEKDLAKNGFWPIVVAVVVSFVTAYILAHSIYLVYTFYIADFSFLAAALLTALGIWLGFTAARMLMHDAFEGRPRQLSLLNLGFELVTLVVMGLVIGLVGV